MEQVKKSNIIYFVLVFILAILGAINVFLPQGSFLSGAFSFLEWAM